MGRALTPYAACQSIGAPAAASGWRSSHAAGEAALRHDRQSLCDRAVDRSLYEPSSDAAPFERLGNAGVHQDEPVAVPAVDELGDCAALPHDEATLVAHVDDRARGGVGHWR